MGIASKCSNVILFLAILLPLLIRFLKSYYVTRGFSPILVSEYNFHFEDIPDLTGETILVTGANAGLGKSTTKLLVQKNADVIMACRSESKCESARRDIENEVGKSAGKLLHPMILDLASLKSVQEFAGKVKSKFKQLDSLILNAGVIPKTRGLTKDGIETQYGVNHLGHFYLTKLLLSLLEKSKKGTIVSVSSCAHYFVWSDDPMPSNLEELNREDNYNANIVYARSKLANVLFSNLLARKLSEEGSSVLANSVHPGAVNTEILRETSGKETLAGKFLISVENVIMFGADEGALTQVYAAVSPDVRGKGVSGKYFHPVGDEVEPSLHSQNKTLQEELWKFSEYLISSKGF